MNLVERIAPVLLFLVAVTVIAGLADDAKVFDVAAREAAHLGRGRTWRLWLLVVALATALTIVLSLDTCAVLLTPVVLAMARQLDIPPKLFAFTTVWLAGTASLLLPVSNLTNLLALHRFDQLGLGAAGLRRPELAAGHRGDRDHGRRAGRAVPPRPAPQVRRTADSQVDDKVLFWGCGRRLPRRSDRPSSSGIDVAWPASAARSCSGRLVRRTTPRRADVVPGPVASWSSRWSGCSSSSPRSPPRAGGRTRDVSRTSPGSTSRDLRLTGTAALGANASTTSRPTWRWNRWPRTKPARMMALLIGVNCGCLLTLWGSLATLLWRDRCIAAGVHISWWSFLWRGLDPASCARPGPQSLGRG